MNFSISVTGIGDIKGSSLGIGGFYGGIFLGFVVGGGVMQGDIDCIDLWHLTGTLILTISGR